MRTPSKTLDYIRGLYAPEDALLREINQTLDERQVSWQIGAEEGKLLQLLLKLHGAKTVVEVGTLGGYSAIWMARALPENGHVYTCEKNPEHAELARGFIARSDVASMITVLEGDAHEQLKGLADKGYKDTFDAMVIDAEKSGYNAYLDWAEENIREGGLIIADNTLLFGSVYADEPPKSHGKNTWEAMKLFNQRLADSAKFDALLIPTEEGLSVAVKR